MERLIQQFDQVFIDPKTVESEAAQRALEIFPESVISYGKPQLRSGDMSADEYQQSKRTLYYTEHKGEFFKRCPGARPGLTCCNYFVLNLGLQCNMDCSYCYLQSFLNTPYSVVYTNIDEALTELAAMEELAEQKVRVGTGEVIDSLSLDPITLYSHKIIEFMKTRPNWLMEFKTKSDAVEQFVNLEHSGNIMVAWSINPQNIIDAEEHNTASLEHRLSAAQKCADKGFPLSFHIDPMIWHPGWQDSYRQLVTEVTSRFKPEQIPVMSVGALRYQPEQRHLMRERFGMESLALRGEMFKGKDGKLRYDQELRTEMFRFVVNEFKSRDKNWNIFMCMETPETWLRTVDQLPTQDSGLKKFFDHRPIRVHDRCGN